MFLLTSGYFDLVYSSPPYRELQNQEESEFLRRIDEISYGSSVSPVSILNKILTN